MAIFTRINGDAAGVVNVDAGRSFANGVVINTGIAAPLSFTKIVFPNGNLAAELTTGGAVEAILRWVEGNATVLAYQVDSTPQISIITERNGWVNDTALLGFLTSQAVLQSTYVNGSGSNIGGMSNVWAAGGGFTVTSTEGFKLA